MESPGYAACALEVEGLGFYGREHTPRFQEPFKPFPKAPDGYGWIPAYLLEIALRQKLKRRTKNNKMV